MDRLPIIEMINNYINEKNVRFHMPGHKGSRGFSDNTAISFLKNAADFDLTEVPGTDNLNFPEAQIKEALELCAKAVGADETFFCINGSTGGIWTVIASAFKPGDKIILSRDCHVSVINAILAFNMIPCYITPEINKEFLITTTVSYEAVKEVFLKNPDAKGIILTRPTYYGICCDIEKISQLTNKLGKILIVDEAHGAHLPYSSKPYPKSSISYADACVQSAHKTLPTLTQGALIHIKGGKIKRDKVSKMLSKFQSSSPSYLIMASLDYSRYEMVQKGGNLLERLNHNINIFKQELIKETGFTLLSTDSIDKEFKLSPDRIVIRTMDGGIIGYDAEKYLRNSWRIQVEMSDLYNIVILCSIFDTYKDFEVLLNAMKDLWNRASTFKSKGEFSTLIDVDEYFKQYSKDRERFKGINLLFNEVEQVKLNDTSMRYAGESIVPYPPGIPLISVAERIYSEDIKLIRELISLGARINGLVYEGESNDSILLPCIIEG